MRLFYFIFAYLFFLLTQGKGQTVTIDWEQNYGGTDVDAAYSVVKTSDSCLIFAGETNSLDEDVAFNHGFTDIWVAKLDPIGNLLWEKTYGGSSVEYAESIYQCIDGGFIIAGITYSSDGDITDNAGYADCWIIKIDSIGNLEWQTTIGGTESDHASSIRQTDDSGFICTGLSFSENGDIPEHFGESDKADLIVFKLNSNGILQWSKVYGGGSDDFGSSITITNDGNYLIVGSTNLYGFFDYWVLKIDQEGNLIWDKSYGGSDYDVAYSILETSEHNILITGEASSDNGDVEFHHSEGIQDMWTLLLDSLGEIIWQRSLGGSGADEGYDLLECSDGSFVIAGITATLNDGDVSGHHGPMFYSDYWIVKLDSNGILKWQKCLGGENGDRANAILRINDEKFIAIGPSSSSDGDVSDHYFGDFLAADVWVVQISETCDQIVYYTDLDDDLFGDGENYIYSCYDTLGYVLISGDCDDTNEDIYPGAAEILNGLDDDCNGLVDDNVSVDDLMGGFSIYPNPVDDVLYINNISGGEATFTISTLTGQIIYESEQFTVNTEFNMGAFTSGLYLIKIHTKNNKFLIELIKD